MMGLTSGEIKNQEGYQIHCQYTEQAEVFYHRTFLMHAGQHAQ
jgi:hypothetical protein